MTPFSYRAIINPTPKLLLLLLVLSANALAQTLPPNNQATDRMPGGLQLGNSLISGRVVYDDNGLPATRHRVQLVAIELLSGPHTRFSIPTTLTNENGEFRLKRIAAGEYYVIAQSVDAHNGSRPLFPFPGQTGDSAVDSARVEQFKKDNLKIAVDGQHNLGVNLRVTNPHFGSISGRVLDSGGGAAVRASVHLLSGNKQSFGANVLTNERGEYKFWGLTAGEYIVSASPPARAQDGEEPTRRYVGILGATYFPSTLESRNSPAITVIADQDTPNIDVRLLPRSLHNLSGVVQMSGDKKPVTGATVRLTRNQIATGNAEPSQTQEFEDSMSFYFSATDKTGHWWIDNIPDGTYRLSVGSLPGDSVNQPFVSEEQDITIAGTDVDNLIIEVSGGSRISGLLSLEGKSSFPQWVRIDANRIRGNARSNVRLDRTGEFTLKAVPPGEISLSAFAAPQEKFYVKSIEANGLDLLRTNLKIGEGEEINNVRVVISSEVGVVQGRLLSQNDLPVAGAHVSLRRVGDNSPRLFGGKLTTKSDDQGNFSLSAAPGVYLILAWRTSDGPSAVANALDRAQREQGPGLTLLPGIRKQLDIRLP